MEDVPSIDRQFREIVADCVFDATDVEQRMLNASMDMRLVIAVHDELSARISLTFCRDDTQEATFQKACQDAQEKLLETIVNLQYSYNLNDADMLAAVELTRSSIQLNGMTLD